MSRHWLILTVLCCAILGATIGVQTATIISLNNQVTQMSTQLCRYETGAAILAAQLSKQGIHVLAPARPHC